MQCRDHVDLLLRKAANDEFTVRKLVPDSESPDEVIGFHAQQAIEKLLKAALSLKGVSYRKTHDLAELIDLLQDSGVDIPEAIEDVRQLGPFAVEFRYDDLPEEHEAAFDRAWAADCVKKTREWVERLMREE